MPSGHGRPFGASRPAKKRVLRWIFATLLGIGCLYVFAQYLTTSHSGNDPPDLLVHQVAEDANGIGNGDGGDVGLDGKPHTFFDIEIAGVKKGRIVFALYDDVSPLAAENFRALCTGEKGIVPEGHVGAGKQYWFKGNAFYRIIHGFIDQAGAMTDSIYGGQFEDDPGGLKLIHDRPGLLSMANRGPDTNSSHFSIMIKPAPHLNGQYVIFGEVVRGFEIAEEINNYAIGKPQNTAGTEIEAIIVNSGQCKTPACDEEY